MYIGKGGESRCYSILPNIVIKISRKRFINLPLKELASLYQLPFPESSAKLAPLRVIHECNNYIHTVMSFYPDAASVLTTDSSATIEMIVFLITQGYLVLDIAPQNFRKDKDGTVYLVDYNGTIPITTKTENPFYAHTFGVFCSFFLRYAHYALTQQDLIMELAAKFGDTPRQHELKMQPKQGLELLHPALATRVKRLMTAQYLQDPIAIQCLKSILTLIKNSSKENKI